MGATAEERVSKRRINELEQKLKKLQRELREFKVEKKKIGQLRKQVEKAAQVEADCQEIIDAELQIKIKQQEEEVKKEESKPKPTIYRCKNVECLNAGGYYKNTGNCDIIETGTRLIIICRDCKSRYTLPNHHN
jgi:vacuolar-type H+-ATPase subunit I/STV1